MADMTDTIKGLLGDDGDEKLNKIMEIIGGGDNAPPQDTQNDLSVSPELISQAQELLQGLSPHGGDSRRDLLMALRPYMRSQRRDSIDSAVKMLNIIQLSKLFKGGLPI